MAAPTTTLAFLEPAQVQAARPQFRAVYYTAFAAPPYSRPEAVADSFADSLARHVQRDGFRCAAGLDENGVVVGFAYGYTTSAGLWWHDLVARVMGPGLAREWLADSFELVEFAVAPEAQGRGLGSRLHDAVLAGLPHAAAVLSTMQAETTALQLYRRRGWQAVLHNFYFPGGSRPYLIMGKKLQE